MKYKKNLLGFLLSSFILSQQCSVFAQEVLRPDARAFPDRTIIIGTYAIVIDQMTNAILEKAENSAQMNHQMNIYFKSDINEGTWYDITQSVDISQISKTIDNVVSYDQINGISLTHYVNEKGEIIDLSTGDTTSTTQIDDVSYPENMPELEGIKEELQIQKGMKEKGSIEGTQAYESLKRIVQPLAEQQENATAQQKETIEQLQKKQEQLQAMEKYIAALRQEGASIEKINEAENQKTALENEKKILCYQKVLERIETEMSVLDYNKNAALIQKYAQYATNIQQSISSFDVTTVTQTSTTLQKILFETEKSFQKFASEGIKVSADNGLERILTIKKAMLGEIPTTKEEKQNQQKLLQEVKQQAEQTMMQLAQSSGQGEDYQKAKENGETESVLQQKQTEELLLLKIALDDIEVALNQIEKLSTDEKSLAEQYQQTADTIQKALENVNEDSFVAQQIKEALQTAQSQYQQKSDSIQLNQLESYQAAKEQRDTAQQEAEQKQQQYLSAAEENKTEELEDIKNQRDIAIEQMQQAQENMEKIEEAFLGEENDQNQIEKDTTQSQENQVTPKEQEQTNIQNDTNTVELQKEDNYTEQEKAEITSVMEQLQTQTGEDFIQPWHILFQDYDVKLLSPIWNTKNGIYVPAQELVRQLGAKVYKSKVGSKYVFKDNGILIEYQLGVGTVFVNGQEMNISPPPTVHHNRVYMPLAVFEKAYSMEHIQQQNDVIVYRI